MTHYPVSIAAKASLLVVTTSITLLCIQQKVSCWKMFVKVFEKVCHGGCCRMVVEYYFITSLNDTIFAIGVLSICDL